MTVTQRIDAPELIACDFGRAPAVMMPSATDVAVTHEALVAEQAGAVAQFNVTLVDWAQAWASDHAVKFNLPDDASIADIVAWRFSVHVPLPVPTEQIAAMASALGASPGMADLLQLWSAMGMSPAASAAS